MMSVQELIHNAVKNNIALMAVLVDPDKLPKDGIPSFAAKLIESKVDLLLIGGSLLTSDRLESSIESFKKHLKIPVVIFPGHLLQVSGKADALLFLSLISGRNPDLLIGQQVHAAPIVKQSGLEVLSTGYMLIDGGSATTVSYISNTQPIPGNKPEIAACTALAGELLGLQNIYLEAGSGAKQPVSSATVKAVRQEIKLPLIVGGGIRDAATARELVRSGANIVVIGSAIEQDPNRMQALAEAIHQP